jgi:hypothetical protein
MAGRGGARPGAGRKRKHPYPGMPNPESAVPGSPVRTAEDKLRAALPDLVDVAISAARAGDKRMLVYCIDRVLGSPVQSLDLEIRRAAESVAQQTGADPDWLVKRAAEIVARAQAAERTS